MTMILGQETRQDTEMTGCLPYPEVWGIAGMTWSEGWNSWNIHSHSFILSLSLSLFPLPHHIILATHNVGFLSAWHSQHTKSFPWQFSMPRDQSATFQSPES
jgi:hypothetical protein